MPKLVILQNDQIKEKIELKDLVSKIGSKFDNDIVLADKRVSSYHAEIKYESRHYGIVDKNSTNGVLVNDQKINSGMYHVLHHNDEIKIGKVTIVFKEFDEETQNSSFYYNKKSKVMDSIAVHTSLLQQHLSSFMGKSQPDSDMNMIQSSVNQLQNEINGLEKSYERLSLLYQISQDLNSELDLKKLLNLVMDRVITVMNAERGFIMLYDKASKSLVPAIARGINLNDGNALTFSRTIAMKVADQKKSVITRDASQDERFSDEKSVIGYNLRSIMCAPLIYKGQVKGVLYIDNSSEANLFSENDMEFLNSIASQAAMAIVNATLYKQAVEKKKYERELELAHQIQMNLLPKSCPIIENINIAARCRPAKMVGGDYYDFLNDALDQGLLGLVIADVSGKGVPASIVVAMTRSIMRTAYSENQDPVKVLQTVNYHMNRELSSGGMFVTVFLAVINIYTQKMICAKAGHNPPYILNKLDRSVRKIEIPGLPCGMFPEGGYESMEINLKKGDRLILYTDGITEAQDEKGTLFETENLLKVISACHSLGTKETISRVYHAVQQFSTEKQFDDETMILVDITG